jgi:uncharacterized protein (DUF302 family)
MEPIAIEIAIEIDMPMSQAVESLTFNLKKEGFGILTTINLSGTLKEKLGVEIEDTLIFGACNPTFAYEAITIDANAGLVLPCNVVVKNTGSKTTISIANPFDIINQPNLQDVASKAYKSLQNVISGIKSEISHEKED